MPAVQIVPVICTSQQVYDYMGISAASAAGNLLNGTTTRAVFITRLMQFAATLIVQWCDYDYTPNQNINFDGMGNGSLTWELPYPVASMSFAVSWDPENPTTASVNILPVIVTGSNDTRQMWRSDNNIFDPNLHYYFEYTAASDPNNFNSWPITCQQVQMEMVDVMYRESMNNDNINGVLSGFPIATGSLSIDTIHRYLGQQVKFIDLVPRWKDAIRGSRKIAI